MIAFRGDWKSEEREHLRFGEWRFFYIWDPEQRESVSEDNAVLYGAERKEGPAGLADFIESIGLGDDPTVIDAEGLAERSGYFLVRGNSRRSCNFRVVSDSGPLKRFAKGRDEVYAPRTARVEDQVVHESWLELDTFLMEVKIVLRAGKPTEVDHSRLILPG